jgi:hypothetical protein
MIPDERSARRTQDVEDRLHRVLRRRIRGPFFVLRHDPPSEPPIVKDITGRFLDVEIEEAVTIAIRVSVMREECIVPSRKGKADR